MKKALIIILFFSLGVSSIASAQAEPTLPSKNFRHWSADARIGLNRLPSDAGYILAGNDAYGLSWGLGLEYTINPLLGIALEYQRFDFNLESGDAEANEAYGLFTINWANLLIKHRHGGWRPLNIYTRTGVGLCFYDVNTDKDISSTTITIPFGLSAEYSISKSFAISALAENRWHSARSLGSTAEISGTNVWDIGLGLRYKFGAASGKHLKNMGPVEYDRYFVQ